MVVDPAARETYHGGVTRGAPYFLFAALTLSVFWKFLLWGHTLLRVEAVEAHLGLPDRREPSAWFRSNPPHGGISDNILLLPSSLRIYNEGLKHGELRLWNPYVGAGYPLYGDPVVHPFYPPHLILHSLLSPEGAFGTSLLLHFFFSGTAMFWLLGALGRSRAACALGGAAWMLLGYNAVWFSTAPLLGLSVFGPLAFRSLWLGIRKRDPSAAAPAGMCMGMALLGSHPQHALHFFLFLLAWLAAAVLRERESRPELLRLAILFAPLSIGTGLAAVQTRLETLEHGVMAATDAFEILYGRAGEVLKASLTLILGKALFPPSVPMETEFMAFAGLGVTGLAALGAVRGFREPPFRFAAAASALILAAVFIAPLARLLAGIPLLNLSSPSRWIFVAGFCLTILAARGGDALAASPRWVPLVPAGAALLLAAALTIGLGPLRWPNGAAVETLLGYLLAAGAALAASRRPRLGPPLATGTVLFELLPLFLQYNPHRDPSIMHREPDPIRFVRGREREPWRGTGALGSPCSRPGAIYLPEIVTGHGVLALYGVENIAGFEAMFPSHYARFCREAGGTVTAGGRLIYFHDFGSPLLDLAGLRYLFMPFGIRPPPRFRLLQEEGGLRIYENTAAFPRAWMVAGCVLASDEEEAVRTLRDPSFRPLETVVLQTQEPLPPRLPAPVPGRIAWTDQAPHRRILQVEAEREGFLVLAETDYAGWEATVDGTPVPVYRADVAFRAVPVPAGVHRIEFRFRPSSVRQGLAGSLGCVALTLAFMAWRRRRRFPAA